VRVGEASFDDDWPALPLSVGGWPAIGRLAAVGLAGVAQPNVDDDDHADAQQAQDDTPGRPAARPANAPAQAQPAA
jgi:hypothetical protein